jgi:outer membrane biosynthesis protein TonB
MNVENVELKDLKDAVKALNEADILETKIKVIGVSKEKLAADLCDIVSQMVENNLEVPDGVMEVYNALNEEAAAPAEKEEEEKPKPKVGKKAAPAPKAEKEEKAEKPKKKASGAPKTGPMSRPKDFDDVKSRLANPANPTQAFDALTLDGGTPKELIAAFADVVKKSFPDFSGFKSETSVNSHIKYREEHGWIYTKGKDGSIKLTGYKA